MKAWEEVLSSALVGTERKTFTPPQASGQIGGLLGQIEPVNGEAALLSAAAILTMQRRTGIVPAKLSEPLPTPSELDDLPRTTPRSGQHLMTMIDGKFKEVLPEWLSTAAGSGKRISEEYLPALLTLGAKNADLRELILPLIGRRGQWLAAFAPQWNYAVSVAEADWELLNTPERVMKLSLLRKSDPDAALSLVEATWSSEPADTRASFVDGLETGLSINDEPFLEAALDDRSKRVRENAINLLVRLPESRYVQRMIERITPLITLKRGMSKSIEVTIPEALDEGMIRDGIDPKPSNAQSKIGERGSWLVALMRAIPPTWWSDQWHMEPPEIVALAGKTEWKEALHEGWLQASEMHPDVAWIRALLLEYPTRSGMLSELSPEEREVCIAPLIPRLDAASRFQLIGACQHTWSYDFGEAVLKEAAAYLKKLKQSDTGYWQILNQIGRFGLYLPPELIDEAQELVEIVDKKEGYNPAATHIKELISTLEFRRRMLKELANE